MYLNLIQMLYMFEIIYSQKSRRKLATNLLQYANLIFLRFKDALLALSSIAKKTFLDKP